MPFLFGMINKIRYLSRYEDYSKAMLNYALVADSYLVSMPCRI